MSRLLEIRGFLVSLYKRYEKPLNWITKLVIMFIVFSSVCSFIPASPLNRIYVVIALSLLGLFLPGKWVVLLAGVVTTGSFAVMGLYSVALVILMAIAITYFSFVRIFPRLSFIIIAVPLCYALNIPLVVPLFVGLFLGLEAIIPTVIGVILKYSIDFMPSIMDKQATDLFDMPKVMLEVVTEYIQFLSGHRAFFATMVVFMGVIAVTYFVKRMSLDYSPYIAIIAGMLLYLIGMVMSIIIMNVEINGFLMIVQAILSAAVGVVIEFLKVVLDYQSVEVVQFEDDDYQYFVRAVPKIKYKESVKSVKHITNIQKDH